MASNALEEKINKIRLQNEEIRRRYEEVEADKKNAAKLNALVQMVPSDDWPERKEPPEFSAPPKNTQKQKVQNKEHNDRPQQHYSGIQERLGRKDHKFAQGGGPPPDPKYNFLADSERETRMTDDARADEDKNKSRNKTPRGAPRKRGGAGGSREAFFKDNRGPHAFHSKEESLPEYEAWRAERNRIDEARINRQKTAEGNWRREWDSNKTNIEKDVPRKGDYTRREPNNYERRNNHYDSDYSNRGHGGSRTYHGSQKNHGHQDYRRPHHEQPHEYKRQSDNKPPLSPNDDRTVTATEKSIKVTVNHGNQAKGPVMSVKVNSPSIAGTGRVGPRQKSRITYSSNQADADVTPQEADNFSRQKSFDEKIAGANINNGQKPSSKSPFPQRKKEGNSKSPFPQRKEFKNDESSPRPKNSKALFTQKNESRDQRQPSNHAPKSQRTQKRTQKPITDKPESFFSSDDAIPSEYNPVKSFNNNSVEQTVDSENDNIEIVSNEIIGTDEQILDLPNDMPNDSSASVEILNQSVCDTVTYENGRGDETDEINKNLEHIAIDENIEKSDESVVNENNSSGEVNKIVDEFKEANVLNVSEFVDTENVKLLSESIENVEQKNEPSLNLQEKIEQNIVEIQITDSDNIRIATELEKKDNLCVENQDEIERENLNEEAITVDKNNEVEEIIYQRSESNEVKNVESHEINVKINPESENDKAIETNDPSNELANENNFIEDNNTTNDSIESIETKINRSMEMIENLSTDDSGFIDDSSKLHNDSNTSNLESSSANDFGKNSQESVKLDSVDITKEICEKSIEICDNHSAASNETLKTVENITEKSENEQGTCITLENPTKDGIINIVEDINETSESSKNLDLKNELKNQSEEKESFAVESTKAIAEESKEV